MAIQWTNSTIVGFGGGWIAQQFYSPQLVASICEARLMYHSSWCALGTNSVRLMAPWGNVRSLADGLGKNSTGGGSCRTTKPWPWPSDIMAVGGRFWIPKVPWTCRRSSHAVLAHPGPLQRGRACWQPGSFGAQRSGASLPWQRQLFRDGRSCVRARLGTDGDQ